MRKKTVFCLFLFSFFCSFIAFTVNANGKYSDIFDQYYQGYGWAGAKYCGTTKNLTIEEVHNKRWNACCYDNSCSTPQSFSGKLSKRQSNLLWYALKQYDYVAGEIYAVNFAEENAPYRRYALSVQIESDGTCTWMGFTYDELY